MSSKLTPTQERVMSRSTGLHRSMKVSSAVMVGVGGTIGTGLFLSSGDVIATAGPGGAIVMYILGAIIAYLMTTCLGEMSAAMPVAGSFTVYTHELLGPTMGLTTSWINWVGGATTITAQVVASAIIMKDIIPNSPTWLWIIVFSLLMFVMNLLDANIFGKVSFWFAFIKILLVIVFIIMGVGLMGGVIGGGEPVGFENFHGEGGAFPTGVAGMGAVILTAFYAYAGTEIFATTAGEIEDEDKMGFTLNMTLIVLFAAVIISIFFIACLLPWSEADVLGSPFVYVLRNAGMHGAALIVNICVLTSALSSCNYFTYATARYLWSMGKFKQAPAYFAKTAKNGVPVRALVISMLFSMIAIIAEFVAEDTVYLFILWFIGGVNIWLYTVICVDALQFRKRYLKEGGDLKDLKFKVLSYPIIPILGIIAFMAMLVVTLLDPGERKGIIVCIIMYIVVLAICRLYVKRHEGEEIVNVDM